jgi:hypothetical protein
LTFCAICLAFTTWSFHRYLHRRRGGIVVIGKPVEFDRHVGRFDVNILHVVESKANPERELHLIVVTEGAYVEVNLEEGTDLLRQLYDGRAWLHHLEESNETA